MVSNMERVYVVIRDSQLSADKMSEHSVVNPMVFGTVREVLEFVGYEYKVNNLLLPVYCNGYYVYECYYTPVCRNAKGNSSNLIK